MGNGGWGIEYSKLRGTEDFFENPPGFVLGDCLLVWCVAENMSVILLCCPMKQHIVPINKSVVFIYCYVMMCCFIGRQDDTLI